MNEDSPTTAAWRFFDGAASVSASMLLSLALDMCAFCHGLPMLGYLGNLTNRDDGIIITATLLLFPVTAALYGVFKMLFAAKEAVERKARERGRQEGMQKGLLEGIQTGRRDERERIVQVLREQGIELTPELAKNLTVDDD